MTEGDTARVTLTRNISADIVVPGGLDDMARELLDRARTNRLMAQAPYSDFWVGAALATTAGRIYVGCNVERVSYTQTTHAEQNAIDTMVSREGPSARIAAIAVVGGALGSKVPNISEMPTRRPIEEKHALDGLGQVPAPCGHCLQCIWENCRGDKNVRIIGLLPSGLAVITTIGDALPMAFGPEALFPDPSK